MNRFDTEKSREIRLWSGALTKGIVSLGAIWFYGDLFFNEGKQSQKLYEKAKIKWQKIFNKKDSEESK